MRQPQRNVVQQLTPPGVGAIAVVRLRGDRVRGWLKTHFSKPVSPGRCIHGELHDGSNIIDDPVVVLHHDLTTADVNLHGGSYVVQAVIDLAVRGGFELLDQTPPGPFPEMTCKEGETLEPIARDTLDWLPLAPTRQALRLLLVQPQAWRRMLAEHDRNAIRHALDNRSLWWMLRTPRVAIVGAPNVGKSTLANRLFAQERSITADMPGTTRDWVGEIANLDGLAVMLVDTPGLRDSDDAIEQQAIARSREQIAEADLVVIVLDASTPPGDFDHRLLTDHPHALIVLNKSDRPPAWDASSLNPIPTIATTGQGIDALCQAIAHRFDCPPRDFTRPLCWTPQQREKLHALLLSMDGP